MLISLVHHYELFCLLVAISGAAQAPLWPACIKIVSSHVDGSSLATIVGLLGTAPYAGATFSAAFVTYIADRSSWRYGLLPIFVSCLVVSLFVLVFLRLGSVGPSKRPTCTTAEQGNSYRKLFAISGVPEVTVAAACLKFGRYALYMWLPLFLTQYLNYSMAKSAVLSSAFDIGGAIGGPLIGYFVDNSKEK
jgi:sugar phosphate permease